MAKLTLHTDIECKVYVDTEFYGIANINEAYIVELPLGVYWIECRSNIDSTIYCHFDVKINSINDEVCHNVELKPLRYAKLLEKYDHVAEFINGFAKVVVAGNVFFINEDGEKAYDYMSPFVDGRSIVYDGTQYGVINHLGEVVIEIEYDHIENSACERFLVCQDGKYGIIDFNGNVVIPITYEWIIESESKYVVQNGNLYGVLGWNGEELLPSINERINISKYAIEVFKKYGDEESEVIFLDDEDEIKEPINKHDLYVKDVDGKTSVFDKQDRELVYFNANTSVSIKKIDSYDNNGRLDIFSRQKLYLIHTQNRLFIYSIIDDNPKFVECKYEIIAELEKSHISPKTKRFVRTENFVVDLNTGVHYKITTINEDNKELIWNELYQTFPNDCNYVIDRALYIAYNEVTLRPILFDHIEENILDIGGHWDRGDWDKEFSCYDWEKYVGGKSGWIKPNGTFSSIIYDQITIHDDKNVVEVCVDGKYGLVTNDEHMLLPLEYSTINLWDLKISKNNKYAKLDSSYRKITPLKYDKIEGDTVLFESKWGFINDKGEEITPLKYDEIRGNTARIGDKWMLIGDNGEELTTPIFDEILNDSWGNRKVGRIVRQGELFALYNNDGKCVIPMGLYKIEILTENFALIQQDGLYGLYDISKGKEALPVKYQDIITYNQQKGWSASSIDKGKDVFIIKNNNKFGCFGANGWIVECIYAKISINGNVIVVQDEEGKYGAFDINGNKIVACKYTSITRSRCGNYLKAYIDKQQYIIFYNHCGEVKIYTAIVEIDVWDFYNESECRLIFANKGGKVIDWDYGRIQIDGGLWACIDQLGNNITPFKYDCLMFNEVGRSHKFIEREHSNTIKFLKVGINGKVGFINSELQEIIPIVYDDCCIVGENMISVCNNGKDGLVDFGNNKLSDIIYDHIGEFNNEIAIVKQDELYGIINNQGVLIHPCKYPYISFDFISGYNEWGGKKYRSVSIPYVSYEKECVHEGEADLFLGINGETYDCVYNDIFAKKNGKWGIINEEKTLFIYQSVCWDSTMDKVHCKMRGFHGVVDYAGNIIIPFIYDSLQIDGSSYIVEQDGEKFYLDENGIYERPYTDEDEKDYYYDDTDWERESYIALGGDPERYYDGCLDDHMDSIGL